MKNVRKKMKINKIICLAFNQLLQKNLAGLEDSLGGHFFARGQCFGHHWSIYAHACRLREALIHEGLIQAQRHRDNSTKRKVNNLDICHLSYATQCKAKKVI